MAYYNHAVLMGYLTKAPEFKNLGGHKCVCSFTLAVRNEGKSGKGYVNYIPVSCWNKTARNAHKMVKKGQQLLCEGALAQSRWRDAEGKTHSRVELMCRTFRFTGKKEDWGDGEAEEGLHDTCGPAGASAVEDDGRDSGDLGEQGCAPEEPGTVPVD